MTTLIRRRMLTVSFRIMLALVSLALAATVAPAQTTQSPLPRPTGYVNDYAGVIDATTKSRMETTLDNLKREQQIEFSVVTVDSTNGRDIFDYSLDVARGWGLGSKDTSKPSLLLLVAIKDRKYQTQVSRHLEGDLPDGLVGQIQREYLVPAFRAGQYGKGLSDTINTYITEVARKRGFSTDTILAPGETAPTPQPSGNKGGRIPPFIFVLAIVFILVWLANRRRRRFGGGGPSGCMNLLLLNTLMDSGGSSNYSGWSSSPGGGGFGGGDSGGGGFGGFGGGGDFGGGGSGGSW